MAHAHMLGARVCGYRYCGIIVCGAFHGLVFLPVVLSLIGPSSSSTYLEDGEEMEEVREWFALSLLLPYLSSSHTWCTVLWMRCVCSARAEGSRMGACDWLALAYPFSLSLTPLNVTSLAFSIPQAVYYEGWKGVEDTKHAPPHGDYHSPSHVAAPSST